MAARDLPASAAVADAGPAARVAVPPPPTWRALSSAPMAPWTERRTPLYTYVLAGDIGMSAGQAAGKTHAGPKSRAQKAMVRLLAEVQAEDGPEADAALAAVHQFLVPAWPRTARQTLSTAEAAARPAPLSLAEVDLIKSRAHLDLLRVVLAGQPRMAQRLRGLGPFLATTRQPLGELVQRSAAGRLVVADHAPVLLIDLGQQGESSLLAAVKSLKVVARAANEGQTSAIGPLRTPLLSALRSTGAAPPPVLETPVPAVRRPK
ncbi:hypothetical protein [Leptothrix discophora]|uniref:Uncharacterized protein n=1 Tax=Leptothrix discophora TaxID=89 RepID=A0ABT9FYG4_LEPDI|nr:hypothetical protein [Leptothrix discophora]MDP4299057.1 hypothetical protein [Leptothrix discophora]